MVTDGYHIKSRKVTGALALIALGAILALPACTDRSGKVRFNGNYYPAKVSSEKDSREVFQVSVRQIDRGMDGALEAGRYEATRYCLKQFGTSEINWTSGPDAEGGRLPVDNGRLLLSGECVTW